MSENNIKTNNHISKEQFIEQLGYKDDSTRLKKALNIFDSFDKDHNQVLDITEQKDVLQEIKKLDKDNNSKISRKEIKDTNTVFENSGIKVSQKTFDAFKKLINEEEIYNSINTIELTNPEETPKTSSNNNLNILDNKNIKQIEYTDIIKYLMNGDDISGIDISKEIKILDKSTIEYNGKKFIVKNNNDVITFVNETTINNQTQYTTLLEEIKNKESNDKINHFINRGELKNLSSTYKDGVINLLEENAIRQEQTVASALLNSNNESSIRLDKQVQNDGSKKELTGEDFLNFLGKTQLTKQDFINFLIAVEKNAKDATNSNIRKYAKDVDIDIKDIVNINAIFNHFSEDGILNKNSLNLLIKELKESNMSNLAQKYLITDSYNPTNDLNELADATIPIIVNGSLLEKSQTGVNNNYDFTENIKFYNTEQKKKLGQVNPDFYTDFNNRFEYLWNRYGDPSEIRITSSTNSNQKKTKINDNITVYQTDEIFTVITKDFKNKTTNINTTQIYPNGLFTITDSNKVIKFENKKPFIKENRNVKFYNNKGKEITPEDFYNQIYNVNPNFKKENSEISYSQNGIYYKGDSYDIEQKENVIHIKNQNKNINKEIDLDYLLKDISDIQYKAKLIAAIQQLPGEALFDLADEVKRIVLKTMNSDYGTRTNGYYINDEININPIVVETATIEEIASTLTHELGHAVEENYVTNSQYMPEIIKSFDTETRNLKQQLGLNETENDEYDLLHSFQQISPSAVSIYATTNADENFAERYAHMMLGHNNSQEILEYYPETLKKQLEHLNKIRETTPNKKTNVNSAYRLDNILKTFLNKNSFKGENINLTNPTEIIQNPNNKNEYTLFVYKTDNKKTPLKIITFNSEEAITTGTDQTIIFKEIPHIIPKSIIEYSQNNNNIAYQTIIDEQNNTTRIKKFVHK